MSMAQTWIQVEVALAESEAEAGVIPAEAARDIAAAARSNTMDMVALGREVEATSHPLVPLIRALESGCENGSGQYLHWGATTQDIIDTGTVLLVKRGLILIEERLAALHGRLVDLAEQYRDLTMVGRTHGQHALPITLGFKFAVIACEVGRHLDRIGDVRKRALVGQLGGAVGTLASLGPRGLEVQRRMFEKLGLGVPVIAWHSARDGLAEVVAALCMVAATGGKVANEVRILQGTEIGELEEPNPRGKIGSSTMPHKRNPMVAENIVAASKVTRQSVALALEAMVQEHERDMGLWGVEWSVIPETFVLTGGILEKCAWILDGLAVNRTAVTRNLALLGGLMMSEAVMMEIAGQVGRSTAHELLSEVCMRAFESGTPLREAILEHPDLMEVLGGESRLDDLLSPARYVGLAAQFVDRAVAYEKRRGLRD